MRAAVVFSSAHIAEANVAGLPGAARAIREVALAGCDDALIAVPGGWQPSAGAQAEIARLAGAMAVAVVDTADLQAGDLLVPGERLVPAERLGAALAGTAMTGLTIYRGGPLPDTIAPTSAQTSAAALAAAGQHIIKATGKPQDGIVSRTINRPISQAISRLLLRWPAIRPVHATCLTALVALLMSAALAFGGEGGLIAGALLFQLASIVDGVDGEIARATFRTSKAGARLDSLVDAATNLAFLAGVSWNVYLRGEVVAAAAGTMALLLMFSGLWLISKRARRNSSGFTFNAVKDHFERRPTLLMTWLTWLTMRDFFALFLALAVVAGLTHLALIAVAVFAAGWFVVVVAMMGRRAA